MNSALWKVEWRRLVRSHSLLSAAALFAVFGMMGPFMALYSGEIIAQTNPELAVDLPPPLPSESVATFVDNAIGLGVLVIVVTASSALSFDARPALALFYRTRTTGAALVLPRYTAVAAGMSTAYALGAALTWYGTAVLFGTPDPAGMLLGGVFVAAFIAFAVALVAFVASLLRSLVAVIAVSSLTLLLLPAAALWQPLSPWIPSTLVGAQHGLLYRSTPADYLPGLAVTLPATALLLAAATYRMARREI